LFYAILSASTILPWVSQFTLGWWSGPLVWFALVALYDRLFVPKGSMCMGIPFMIPLTSLMALVVFNVVVFIKWALK
jgi:hypothetical protein